MIFYNELSSTVHNSPRISYKNMASFSYNTDDFPALPLHEFSCQSVPVFISVKLLLLEKKLFVSTSKVYMFPLQSDDIFKSETTICRTF